MVAHETREGSVFQRLFDKLENERKALGGEGSTTSQGKSSATVTVTRNEILTGFKQPEKFFLAIVLVAGETVEPPCYIRSPFRSEPEFGITSVNYDLEELLSLAGTA